jgi:hypothetical protein
MDFLEMEKERVWVLYRTLSPSLTPAHLLLEGSLNPYSWQKQDQNRQNCQEEEEDLRSTFLVTPAE